MSFQTTGSCGHMLSLTHGFLLDRNLCHAPLPSSGLADLLVLRASHDSSRSLKG